MSALDEMRGIEPDVLSDAISNLLDLLYLLGIQSADNIAMETNRNNIGGNTHYGYIIPFVERIAK